MQPDIYRRLAEVEHRHWWFHGRRTIVASVIERLGLPSPARILEAGCGTGGNLAMLDHFGEVRAFEPDTAARAVATDKGVGPVNAGHLPDGLPAGLVNLDLACAFDVLEHVDDDCRAVDVLAACLKPGGYLVATVPALAWLWSEYDEAHEHRRRYSRRQLVALVQKSGLEIVSCSYYNLLLLPPIALLRVGRRLLGIADDGSSDYAVPGDLINRVLYTVFASERRLLRFIDLPIGVSLLVVARRAS